MLPLQVSTVNAGLSIRLLPSARALNLSLSQKRIDDPSKMKLLTVGDLNSSGLPPLKYSGIESFVFSDLFSKAGASVHDNTNQLSLDSIESEISNATHVHFSCHGNFAPFSPLNSVLYLEGDEQLPVESLFRPALRLLGTELVILSACNSASIEHWRTPDETIGFPAAFLIAGAKTVIAAQWPVEDSATFLLMQQFCKEFLRNSFDAARSLANSQLWLQKATKQEIQVALIQIHDSLGNNEMRAKRLLKELQVKIESLNNEYPFKDRLYWAGFVCVGS
jgi:CHAT domain-containing protein